LVDIKDVPRDAALEALPLAVDPETIKRYLAPHFGKDVTVQQVKVERFQYKPGRSARLTYVVKLRDRTTAKRMKQIICGRMETPAAIQALHAKMRRREWVTPAYGPALLWLPDLSMLLWGFPNDPKLEGVEQIGDPQHFLELLRTLPAGEKLAAVASEGTVVKYVPGKRLVMKQVVRDASGRETVLYTKTFGHDRGQAIHDVMRHLYDCSRSDARALTTPEPLGWLPGVRTLVQRELAGWSAVETLRNDAWQRFMQDVGQGLARIHASGVQGLESWTSEDEIDNLQQASQLLLDHDARYTDRIGDFRLQAAAQRRRLPAAPQLPIHTAFRYTQLLADADRLALVDFDGFRQGDAACDVGSFLAHLHYLAVKNEIPLEQSRQAADVFLESYRRTAVHGVDDTALAWYTAVILVAKHAQKMVKRLKEDGDEKLARLLEDASSLLRRNPIAE